MCSMWVEILFKHQSRETWKGNQRRGMNYKQRSCHQKLMGAWMPGMEKVSSGSRLWNCKVELMCTSGTRTKPHVCHVILLRGLASMPPVKEDQGQGRTMTLCIFGETQHFFDTYYVSGKNIRCLDIYLLFNCFEFNGKEVVRPGYHLITS